MNPTEAARHLRRLERKLDDLRDELDELRGKLEASPAPAAKPGKAKNDADSEFES